MAWLRSSNKINLYKNFSFLSLNSYSFFTPGGANLLRGNKLWSSKMRSGYSFLFVFLIGLLSSMNIISAYNSGKFHAVINKGQVKVDVSNKNLADLHTASSLVISCVDFRLRDELSNLLNVHMGLLDDYDEIALPGAALGLNAPQYAHWKHTIHDVIDIVKNLHHIKRIILVDHRGCGAYNLIKGKQSVATKDKEYQTHKSVLLNVKAQLNAKFPKLEVYTLLMGLDGLVEVIK